jgi:cardiolipin synthase
MVHLQAGHSLQLLLGGVAFFPALIQAIETAREEVRLETYIFHDDPAGAMVLEALEHAARRGVAVYLVMDGIGTPRVSGQWVARFQAAGIRWAQFSPPGSWGWLLPVRWRRMHRKLCVVDRQLGFCGGINLMDDFFELNHGWQTLPRLDFAVQVRGPLVRQMQLVMEQFWRGLLTRRALAQGNLWEFGRTWLPMRLRLRPGHNAPTEPFTPPLARSGASAGFLLRDNVRHRRDIERAYRRAIAHARSEVLIANAYFLPGAALRRALVHAARRGVRVRLLLQGRYEFFMQFHAAKPFYRALLTEGVEIYEYQEAFLHAKVAVIDGRWATVGSSNLDPFSLLLAREANVVVDDAAFAGTLRQHLLDAIDQRSVQVMQEGLARRPWLQRLKGRLAYGLLRLSLYLTGENY